MLPAITKKVRICAFSNDNFLFISFRLISTTILLSNSILNSFILTRVSSKKSIHGRVILYVSGFPKWFTKTTFWIFLFSAKLLNPFVEFRLLSFKNLFIETTLHFLYPSLFVGCSNCVKFNLPAYLFSNKSLARFILIDSLYLCFSLSPFICFS